MPRPAHENHVCKYCRVEWRAEPSRSSPDPDLRQAALELVDAIDEGRMFTNKVLRVRAALSRLGSSPDPTGPAREADPG